MRVYVLYFAILVLFGVGFREWFLSFCGLVVLSAFMGHQDMPTKMMGVPGLNPWNVLLAVVLFHWLTQRRAEGLRWDLKGWPAAILIAYVLMVVIGCVRAALDIDSFPRHVRYATMQGLLIDELFNPLRYMIPALLLYDGCRSRRRAKMAIAAIVLMGVCYALLVDRCIPVGTLLGTESVLRSRNRIQREIGLHANDMAFVLVFLFWGLVASCQLLRGVWPKLAGVAGMGVIGLAVALCKSRGGYVGFVVVGAAILALRRPLLLVPLVMVIAIAPMALPGLAARAGMGFGGETRAGETATDWDAVMAGRPTMWLIASGQVFQNPLWGYGRYIMLRDRQFYESVLQNEDRVPEHPHNAYLEVLLDYGAIGLAVTLAVFLGILKVSFGQMRRYTDPLVRTIGTIAFAAALDNLVVGISSRALLPRPSAMAMWCAFALCLRLWMQERRQPAPAVAYRAPSPAMAGAGQVVSARPAARPPAAASALSR
jgi:O-antigen ligase